MTSAYVSVGGAILLIWMLRSVHEFGHYLAGRRIVGIPADSIRLVDPYLPRYVALRDGDQWVAPSEPESYRSAYRQFDPTGEHAERFAGAGELVQAAVVVPIATAFGLAVSVPLATTILVLSLLSTAFYVALDLVATIRTGSPAGDYSVLWRATPRLPLFLLFGFTSVHLVPLLLLT